MTDAILTSSPLPFNLGNLLLKACPGSKFSVSGNTYDGLTWLDDSPKPSFNQCLLWSKLFPEPKGAENLLADLKPFLAKAITTTAYNHFALMMTLFTARMNEDLLSMTLGAVRKGMPIDFTADEVSQINLIFKKYGIKLQID